MIDTRLPVPHKQFFMEFVEGSEFSLACAHAEASICLTVATLMLAEGGPMIIHIMVSRIRQCLGPHRGMLNKILPFWMTRAVPSSAAYKANAISFWLRLHAFSCP